jgi:hypothetical protein
MQRNWIGHRRHIGGFPLDYSGGDVFTVFTTAWTQFSTRLLQLTPEHPIAEASGG